MDQGRFDTLTRSLASAKTRRGVLGGLAALLVGGRAAGLASAQESPSCPIPGQTRNRKGDCLCPAGTDPCPDGCFDLKRSSERCGSCSQSCAGGTCRKGRCSCPDGLPADPSFGCIRSFAGTCRLVDAGLCFGLTTGCNDSDNCACDVSLDGTQALCVDRSFTCGQLVPCPNGQGDCTVLGTVCARQNCCDAPVCEYSCPPPS